MGKYGLKGLISRKTWPSMGGISDEKSKMSYN